jgi:drug/metabolite transporter (DMT)-like permease
MSEQLKIIIAYILICLIWGSTWMVIKIGLEGMTPFLSASLRFAVASIILYTIILIKGISIPTTREAKWFFLIVALTSFSIPFALVYWGEQRISSGLTSVLFAVFPFCVGIVSALMLPDEKLTLPKIVGIIIGFSGVVTIFANDIHVSSAEQVLGMLAVILSAILQSYSAVLIKKDGHHISPYVVSFVPMTIGAVLLFLGSITVEDLSQVQFNFNTIFSIVFLGLFGTVVTFVSYFWLIKRVQVVFLSLTSFITPVIAVSLGAVFLGEHVSAQLFAGASLVLLGIVAANFSDIRNYIADRSKMK